MTGHDRTGGPYSDMSIGRLKRRADFLRAAKGRRWHGKGFTLQGGNAGDPSGFDPDRPARVGFTVTKKVGNAVVRNRARRRLREALRLAAGLPVEPGCDYVIVARLEAIRLPFRALKADLGRAFSGLGGKTRQQGTRKGRATPPPDRREGAHPSEPDQASSAGD